MEINEEILLDKIVYIINSFLSANRIYLFGSRAKGNHKYNSDFDIAIESEEPSIKIKRELEEKIEDSAGLFKVDLVFLETVDEKFKQIIMKTAKLIYER